MAKVVAQPYTFPYDGELTAATTCLIIIDMQVDFCGHGGYVDRMGYDISLTRAPIEPLQRVLKAARAAGVRVLHTREGHRPSLSDLAPNKLWRSEQIGAGIGSVGPTGRVLVRGEPGWDLIDELKPLPHEDIIEGPGKGKMVATDMEHILRCQGITRLLLGGITTDVCVHTTMREANDRGFECCLISDGTAATAKSNHDAALKMITMQGGVFGAHADSVAICAALDRLPRPMATPTPAPAWPTPTGFTGFPKAATGEKGGRVDSALPFAFEWPSKSSLCLLMIDWQRDFLDAQGFGASVGNDVTKLRAALGPAAAVLDACRKAGHVVAHTLEAHKPDLSDCPPSKKRRFAAIGETINADLGRVLIANEPGNAIVPEVAPIEGELVIHKPGKGAFWDTDLEVHLRAAGVTHLLVTGVTTEVCVQTTMREANDRGFECLVIEDATESYFPHFKKSTLEMIVAQNGIVGWTASSAQVIAAIQGKE